VPRYHEALYRYSATIESKKIQLLMKKNCYLLISLLAMAVSVCFISCSKDDDGLDSPIAQKVIGTWYASDTSNNRDVTVTFYSDGTGTLNSVYYGKHYTQDSEMTGEFIWSCNGNTIMTHGQYTLIDYNNGTVDTDFAPDVDYHYNESSDVLSGGRYSSANTYRRSW